METQRPRASDPGPIVHVVDDDEPVRESLCLLLGIEGLAVRTYPGAQALLASAPPSSGCVLIDFRMPGMDGLQLQAALAAAGIRLPVVVMTAHGEISLAVRAMRSGAVDFLEKPFGDDQVIDAVRRALAQNAKDLEHFAQSASAAKRIAQLTPREQEVFEWLVAGKSNKEIAQVLGTSPRTIDVHRARVFHKLEADSLPELVRIALSASKR